MKKISGFIVGSMLGSVLFCCASVYAATVSYPLNLVKGWNLAGNSLSTPIDVKAAFGAQTNIVTIWKWNAPTSTWAFYAPSLDANGTLASYAQGKGYTVLGTINAGEGYWVNAAAPISLGSQTGAGFSLTAANLGTGWNLSATADAVTPAAFSTTVGNVTTLWAWDNATSSWYFYAPSLAANNTLANYITQKGYKDFGILTLDNGLGFWINYAGTATGGTAPVAPTGVTASASGSSAINVSWAAVSGATGYNVYRSATAGQAIAAMTKLTATPATGTSYADSGLTASTAYYYKVAAVNAAGASAASAEASATTSTAAVAMTILSITSTSNNPGSQIIIAMTGLTSTTANPYRVAFGGNVTATADLVSVPAGLLYVTIPSGAVSGPLTITDLGTSASVTSSSFTVSSVTVQESCSSLANVVTSLPASGVAGVNWSDCSKQAPNTNSAWGKVVWSGTQFAALRSAGGVATSTDGYVWTAYTYATKFIDFAFNGSKWVGISNSGIFYSSGTQPSGWTSFAPTLNSPGQLMNIFAANGRFFIGTNNGSFLTSTDGVNWTETANSLCLATYQSAAYAGNINKLLWDGARYQMFVGSINAPMGLLPTACSSTDGVTWTGTSMSFSPATTGARPTVYNAFMPRLVAWNGTQYLTVDGSGRIWTSPTGIAWTLQAGTMPLALAMGLKDLILVGTQYAGVGYDGNYVNSSIIITSLDGMTWTQQSAIVPTGQTLGLMSLAYSSNLNRLVGMGYFTTSGTFSGSAMYVSP